MAYSDNVLGLVLVALSFIIFVYYTIWVLLLVSELHFQCCFTFSVDYFIFFIVLLKINRCSSFQLAFCGRWKSYSKVLFAQGIRYIHSSCNFGLCFGRGGVVRGSNVESLSQQQKEKIIVKIVDNLYKSEKKNYSKHQFRQIKLAVLHYFMEKYNSVIKQYSTCAGYNLLIYELPVKLLA
jgi:type IV secretory pathway VirB3-like protein